jgi:hypothetical protein
MKWRGANFLEGEDINLRLLFLLWKDNAFSLILPCASTPKIAGLSFFLSKGSFPPHSFTFPE